jgi:hypothetical protein
MANIPIWDGSAIFNTSQNPTPFGFYDTDNEFAGDAPNVAIWCAQRLGYPLVDVELQQEQFFSAFEEAVTEYGSHVYQFQIINNMGNLLGFNTSSADVSTNADDNHLSDNSGIGLNNINVSGLMDNPTGQNSNYSNDSPTGGSAIGGKTFSASLHVKRGIQKYNLLSSSPGYSSTTFEWGANPLDSSGAQVFGQLTHSSSLIITDTDGLTVHYRATTGSSAGIMDTGSGEYRRYLHQNADVGEFITGSYAGTSLGINDNPDDLTVLGQQGSGPVSHLSASVDSFIDAIKNGPQRSSFTISSSLSASGAYFITLTNRIEGAGGNTTISSSLIGVTASAAFTGGSSGLSFESSGSQIQALSKRIDIKKIYHYAPSAINRYFDPYAGTGTGIQSLMQTFGFGNFSPGVNFMLMPMYFDALKLQAIEMNDSIRKSAYHFEITGKHLKLFPIPTSDYTLWFDYTMANSADNLLYEGGESGGEDVPRARNTVTNQSNVPYVNPTYSFINSIGRQWIRKYTLALAKEMLGSIRGKYQSIPIPGDDTTLDYSRLLSEAQSEKEALVVQLREDLEKTNALAQAELNSGISQATQDFNTTAYPYQIYIH